MSTLLGVSGVPPSSLLLCSSKSTCGSSSSGSALPWGTGDDGATSTMTPVLGASAGGACVAVADAGSGSCSGRVIVAGDLDRERIGDGDYIHTRTCTE